MNDLDALQGFAAAIRERDLVALKQRAWELLEVHSSMQEDSLYFVAENMEECCRGFLEWKEGRHHIRNLAELARDALSPGNALKLFYTGFYSWQLQVLTRQAPDSAKQQEVLELLTQMHQDPEQACWHEAGIFMDWIGHVVRSNLPKPDPRILCRLNLYKHAYQVPSSWESQRRGIFITAMWERDVFHKHFNWLQKFFGQWEPWLAALPTEEVQALVQDSEWKNPGQTNFPAPLRPRERKAWEVFEAVSKARREAQALRKGLQEEPRPEAQSFRI